MQLESASIWHILEVSIKRLHQTDHRLINTQHILYRYYSTLQTSKLYNVTRWHSLAHKAVHNEIFQKVSRCGGIQNYSHCNHEISSNLCTKFSNYQWRKKGEAVENKRKKQAIHTVCGYVSHFGCWVTELNLLPVKNERKCCLKDSDSLSELRDHRSTHPPYFIRRLCTKREMKWGHAAL